MQALPRLTVLGATGRTGGATALALLSGGAAVRAVTRDRRSPVALALAEAGAEVVEAVTGRRVRRVPIPVWLSSLLAGDELPKMWAFVRERGAELRLDRDLLREIHPGAMGLERWLRRSHSASPKA